MRDRELLNQEATARLTRGLLLTAAEPPDNHEQNDIAAGQANGQVTAEANGPEAAEPPALPVSPVPATLPSPRAEALPATDATSEDQRPGRGPAGQAGSTGAARPVTHPDAPDEPLSSAPADEARAPSAPKADAGPDRIIWIGWDEIPLAGSGTGEQVTFSWKQLRGPTSLKIGNPRRELTVARGFRLGADMSWDGALYAFELTVTDAHGQQATDTVEYVVLAAPDLTIIPTPRRHFALRDGYWLAHFDAWATDVEGNQFTFRIAAPTTVTFTKIGGGSYDLASREVAGKYTYEVTLCGQPGEVSSWVEFLVDTADRIPGIVQLGVSWNGR